MFYIYIHICRFAIDFYEEKYKISQQFYFKHLVLGLQ